MEVGTDAEASMDIDTPSSAFSSSILGTAGESDESSLRIFLRKKRIAVITRRWYISVRRYTLPKTLYC